MKNTRMAVGLILILMVALFTSCGSAAAKTVIEMEMTENYDSSDPFINEKLFYVSDDIDTLNLEVLFQMKGESAILEIADNRTGEILWSDTWDEDIGETKFTISLTGVESEKEYVIRFTGTEIDEAKIVITSENSLVKERERPLKPAES